MKTIIRLFYIDECYLKILKLKLFLVGMITYYNSLKMLLDWCFDDVTGKLKHWIPFKCYLKNTLKPILHKKSCFCIQKKYWAFLYLQCYCSFHNITWLKRIYLEKNLNWEELYLKMVFSRKGLVIKSKTNLETTNFFKNRFSANIK